MTDAYRDPSQPIADRVEDLLARLTLEEKAGQISQYFYFAEDGVTAPDADAVPGQELPEGLTQPEAVEKAIVAGGAGSVLFVKDARTANRLQKLAVEQTRLGIPLVFGFDVIHGLRTILPAPIGQAASWCPEAIEAGQRVAAKEARAVGIHWAFAPMVDIARDPRWGRIIEGAGEDPVLGGAVAAAQVRGFQGGDSWRTIGPDSVMAGPKHFAGYGAALGGRDYEESDISDTQLHNLYFPPFRAAVEAGAGNIMSAYMDLNGVPASGNRWLLTDVLRDDLGFDGFVVSDANAVRSLTVQHFAEDFTDAGVRALHAGLDMEMCMVDAAYSRLPQAVADGSITEDEVDQAVRRVLAAKFALGLFENPWAPEDSDVLDTPAHRDVARDAAEKTLVLLKNDRDALPLDASSLHKVAVIGQLAGSQRDTLGPWCFAFDVAETVTIVDGLRAQFGDGVDLTYVEGASITNRHFPSMFDDMDVAPANTPEGYDDDAEIDKAVAAAKDADVAVVVVGQRQNQIGEFASSDSLDLPGRQLEQLQRIVQTGTKVVLVVMSGRPLDLRWADENVPAILQAWYPGTRGGEAVARALVGEVSPAGRLPFTWPRHVGQVPMVYNSYRSFQPENAHRRYWEGESTPLYVFGHGLTYGAVEYSDLKVDASPLAVGDTATVSVTVTNTGDRTVDEVVQLYIHQRHGTSTRPVKELKGFRRITLAGGASQTVELPLGPDQLRYWTPVTRDWVQDATTLDLWVGGSSAAELHAELEVVAKR